MDNYELKLEAKVDNLHQVLDFLEENLASHEASMKVISMIQISAEEMYANICMYAYEGNSGECQVKMSFDNDNVIITFIDSGLEFDPLAKEDPDIHADIEDRGVGGLGIFMVKKYMDECTYQRSEGKNIFTMRKALK